MPPATLEEVLRVQASACADAGSDLYARVLDAVIADVQAGGACAALLAPHEDDPYGSALALRLLGAVHRLVLDGRAPELAASYPSTGGDAAHGDPGAAFVEVVRAQQADVARLLHEGVQTNEVGRSAVLVGGYARVLEQTGLPLRVLEVGASAGLNLRWDRFAYDTGEVVAGDPGSPVRFADVWEGAPPPLPATFAVAERRGCDRNPIDPTTDAGRRTLLSFVWPDQVARLARLEAAIGVARQVPAAVDRADAGAWLEERLRDPLPGVATVVAHSIVLQYVPRPGRARLQAAITGAGRRATADAPLAWLRMEPAGGQAELRLTTWPGAREELLATAGFHGTPIRWLAASRSVPRGRA